jgi:1-acyl-sn-glycerol-3-phosphate acyltransferase
MRSLLSLVLWIIGGIYFFIFCVVTILLALLFKPRRADPVVRGMARFLFKLIFVKVRMEGGENFRGNPPYLIMANHESILDLPLLKGYIPVFFRGIEAYEHFRWPIYGCAIRSLGNIPINRGSACASLRSLAKAEEALAAGDSILILPEGHRTQDGNLLPFKSLPFHLAKRTEVPILPAGLIGPYHLKKRNSWIIRPQKVKIKFGVPIRSEEIRSLSPGQLKKLVRDRIQGLLASS